MLKQSSKLLNKAYCQRFLKFSSVRQNNNNKYIIFLNKMRFQSRVQNLHVINIQCWKSCLGTCCMCWCDDVNNIVLPEVIEHLDNTHVKKLLEYDRIHKFNIKRTTFSMNTKAQKKTCRRVIIGKQGLLRSNVLYDF